MNLQEFKQHFLRFPEDKIFNFGISEPFSWRGIYTEVAFSIIEKPMSREKILENIKLAYTKTFYGYKGGEYTYCDNTTVNFEECNSSFSDGRYLINIMLSIAFS